MRLEQLQQIIEIEKYKSISKAAKALYMGQPALSTSLNSLENEIGVVLFKRTPTGVEVTEEGAHIVEYAKKIMEMQSFILNYNRHNKELFGTVTVIITQAYSFMYGDIILELKKRHPKANLKFEVCAPQEVVERIINGKANIGVTMWEFFPEQSTKNLELHGLSYEVFATRSLALYVSQYHKFAENESVTLNDLQNEEFVAYSPVLWNDINHYLHANTEPLMIADRENLKQIISNSSTIAIMPETFAQSDFYCSQGMIKLIPIIGCENFCQGKDFLIYSSKHKLTMLEESMIAILREKLGGLL